MLTPNFINLYFPFIPEKLPLLSVLLSFLSISMTVFALGKLVIKGKKNYAYLYNLANRKELLDHWIIFLAKYTRKYTPPKWEEKMRLTLSRSGWRPEWDFYHFLAQQFLVFNFTFFILFFLFTVCLGITLIVPLFTASVVAIFPLIGIKEKARNRIGEMNKNLGSFIDYLALAISAGLDFNGALKNVLENSPKDALTEEFQLMMKSINLGKTKAEALREMKQRIDTIQINQFVETMVQSIEQGSAVVETLNTIAGALNSKRFQIAEEEAGKISIKMMIPLIIFILPAVMLILLGPMILEFIIVSR